MPNLNDPENIYIVVEPGEELRQGHPVTKRADDKWYNAERGESVSGIAMGGKLVMQRGFIFDVDAPDSDIYMKPGDE